MGRENPVEDKHRRLVRSHRSSPYDRELKPNAKIRDELGVSIRALIVYMHLADIITLGNPQLSSFTASHFRGERLDLEVPLLSRKGQAWFDQVPEIGDLERSLGSQTGGRRVVAYVDGGRYRRRP
jgi:hypothetical protein